MFKMAWFIVIALVEWRIIRESDWLPTCLGGQSNDAFWVDGDEAELQLFYEAQLAYHLHSLFFSLIAGAKPEMHVHHVVTVVLITLSDVLDYRRVGFIVFFLHDVPDITSGAIKATLQARRIPLLLLSFTIHLFSWAFFRLNLFAQVVLSCLFCSFIKPKHKEEREEEGERKKKERKKEERKKERTKERTKERMNERKEERKNERKKERKNERKKERSRSTR